MRRLTFVNPKPSMNASSFLAMTAITTVTRDCPSVHVSTARAMRLGFSPLTIPSALTEKSAHLQVL
jgi:hypothetical protein